MNMWLTFEHHTSVADMLRAGAERHRKLRRPETVQDIAPVTKPVVVVLNEKAGLLIELPRPQRPDQDAHVRDWERWKLRGTSPIRAYIFKRCEELSVSYGDITGKSRRKDVVPYRDRIVYEIKTAVKPTISWPELGRMFGRDHTSMIASYRRAAAAVGDEAAKAMVDLKHQRARDDHQRRKAAAA